MFVERMDDDLDTPRAVAGLFELVRRARAAVGPDALALAAMVLEGFEQALGLPLGSGTAGSDIPPEVIALVVARDVARKAKDWSEADRLRNELTAMGWTLEDGPEGTEPRRIP
jgi:cysteinyl-tRNA synthetase